MAKTKQSVVQQLLQKRRYSTQKTAEVDDESTNDEEVPAVSENETANDCRTETAPMMSSMPMPSPSSLQQAGLVGIYNVY